jgi:hypothetical protein
MLAIRKLLLSAITSLKKSTAEPQNKKPQNIEIKNIAYCFQKLLLFEIPCSIFDIQNTKQAESTNSRVKRTLLIAPPSLDQESKNG